MAPPRNPFPAVAARRQSNLNKLTGGRSKKLTPFQRMLLWNTLSIQLKPGSTRQDMDSAVKAKLK